MRKKLGVVAGAVVIAGFCAFGVRTASASLFSSISYNQSIEVAPNPLSGPPVFKYISGTTLPVNQTLSLDLNGETSQATYNFSDNGSVAVLSIQSSLTLTGISQNAGESTINSYDTGFEFTQPVAYTAEFEDTATGTFNGLPGGVELHLATGQGVFAIGGPAPTGDFETSGQLVAGVGYYMDEQFSIANGFAGDDITGSASDQVTLTFTAIPEPSSFCLLTLAGTGILTRRRRLSLD